MTSRRRILIISSLPPEHSANLGLDLMKALSLNGDDVIFFSRWKSKLQSDRIKNMHRTLWQRIVRLFVSKKRYRKIFRDEISGAPLINGVRILYPNEKRPQESTRRIIGQIKGKYDYIVTLFWQGMYNSTTLRHLSQKFKCPILIYAVDMAPITGGCYYFDKCNGYTHQCGSCPGLNSDDSHDPSHVNYLIKKQNYINSHASFIGNTWMTQCAIKSGLFDSNHVFYSGSVMNTNQFYPPKSISVVRKQLGLSENYTTIFFARSANDPRKGNKYIIDATKKLWQKLTDKQKKSFLIITAGHDDTIGADLRPIGINVHHMGMVDTPTLVKIYQSSTAFISASTDDAGPSMINQSLLCGTPVISFATGVALDIVINRISGWRIAVGSSNDICKAMLECISMSPSEYEGLRDSSRNTGVTHNSYEAVGQNFEKIYSYYESAR